VFEFGAKFKFGLGVEYGRVIGYLLQSLHESGNLSLYFAGFDLQQFFDFRLDGLHGSFYLCPTDLFCVLVEFLGDSCK
jgi:hypothetical protein